MSEREEAAPERSRRTRVLLLAVIAALYVFSVPWYRAGDAPLALWWGLPDWVFTALACYLAAAVLNARVWWITEIADPPAAKPETGPDGPAR